MNRAVNEKTHVLIKKKMFPLYKSILTKVRKCETIFGFETIIKVYS